MAAPQTIEEVLVGQMMVYEGCTKEAVIPPPSSCSDAVHMMYSFADLHLLTILIAIVFVGMILSVTAMSWKVLSDLF
jgi:hypothetical protein